MFICICLVEDLSEIVPQLLSKLRVVEEKKPVNNISTNIMKIRELIAQAHSVAKKVHQALQINIILTDPHVKHNTFSQSHSESPLRFYYNNIKAFQHRPTKMFYQISVKNCTKFTKKCIVLCLFLVSERLKTLY